MILAMKKQLLLFFFIIINTLAFSQESYTINNETLKLKTEVDGNLDLLWNVIDNEYRYFVKTQNGNIQELKNTKGEDKKYQEEYKTVLKSLTEGYGVSVEKVKLTLSSLRDFFNVYNATTDLNFNYEEKAKLQARLGVFGGLTNQPFVVNPDNKSVPFFGFEFEILEQKKLARHALFFNLEHALESDDFKYTATQLAIGYRFRFINRERFNLYTNLKIATYTTSEETKYPNTPFAYKDSFSGIQAPFILGLGGDIKISDHSFITLAYHDIYAVFIDNHSDFPIDFAIGYKLNL